MNRIRTKIKPLTKVTAAKFLKKKEDEREKSIIALRKWTEMRKAVIAEAEAARPVIKFGKRKTLILEKKVARWQAFTNRFAGDNYIRPMYMRYYLNILVDEKEKHEAYKIHHSINYRGRIEAVRKEKENALQKSV